MHRPRSAPRSSLAGFAGLAAAALLALAGLLPAPAAAQDGRDAGAATPEAVVRGLFDAMRAADSAAARRLLHPDARLHRPVVRDDGELALSVSGADGWLNAIGGAEPGQLDEKIWGLEIRVDGRLATAWMNYAFYLGDELHHCGVNAFQLVRMADGWKAFGVADTSREEDCREPHGERGDGR